MECIGNSALSSKAEYRALRKRVKVRTVTMGCTDAQSVTKSPGLIRCP